MKKRNTAKLAWETTWQWINTKLGFCIAVLVGAVMTAIFVGSSVLSRILWAIVGAAIGILMLIGIPWLMNSIIISYRQRRDTKEVLSKIKRCFDMGTPLLEQEYNQVSQLVDLKGTPVSVSHTKTVSISARIVWEGQSNAIYSDMADKEMVKVDFAIVGHNYTSGAAKIGLEDFCITTVGFADKNSVFKVFCENQELGSVSVIRNYKGEFQCQARSTEVIINGSLIEAPVVVRKIIGNKVTWEKNLRIPLDLQKGEEVQIKSISQLVSRKGDSQT